MIKRTRIVNHLLMLLITSIILSMCISCNTAKKDNISSAEAPAMFSDQVLYTDTLGTTWVPLQSVVHSLGLHMKDSEESVKIGYTDPMYEVYPGHMQALTLGSSTQLEEAPTRWMGQSYMSIASLSHLLHTQVFWNQPEHRVEISPLQNVSIPPSDQNQEKTIRITSTSVNTNELVSYAKKYMGVPYDFGAKPYNQSKTFDCSSFTQHVFKKFNIDLPRLASSQGQEGVNISRNNLNQGDLIFFTVPGRFKSNAIPGHVGIYIGNGKFIHTWGEPGVQISNVDSGYWSDVILYMRRVI
jgi:cell wall-associated NlpC family hydrolase